MMSSRTASFPESPKYLNSSLARVRGGRRKKLDESSEPHRPFKVVYSSLYANVTPSFVVDISAQFDRRMAALMSYQSQYGGGDGSDLFPGETEIRERLGAIARFYGNLIGVKYGEPFVTKETMRVDDLLALGVRSF